LAETIVDGGGWSKAVKAMLRHVIASEAKQSSFLLAAPWIASLALAMTVFKPSSPAKAGDPVVQRQQ
jgi:hypothetical protein